MQQIRSSVFETNSSSSHSLTLGTGALAPAPFAPEEMRLGVVEVGPGDYHWEWRRYYQTKNKIEYLLTQLTGGDVQRFLGMSDLRESDSKVDLLCQVVKKHTGCDLALVRTSGGIDHDSEGVGLEVFDNEDALTAFLFDESACIETGNDNSEPPWDIETDSGTEPYYKALIKEAPDSHVKVQLLWVEHGRNKLQYEGLFTTKDGKSPLAIVPTKGENSLHRQIIAHGVVQQASMFEVGSWAAYEGCNAKNVLARTLADPNKVGPLCMSPNLKASSRSTKVDKAEQPRSEVLVLTVKVPKNLASRLAALKPFSEEQIALRYAKAMHKQYRQHLKDQQGGPHPWLQSQLEKWDAAVKSLTQKERSQASSGGKAENKKQAGETQ